MLSNTFLVSFLNTNTAVICLSIGASAIIISGEIDISLGAMVSVINVFLIKMQAVHMPFQIAVLLALLASMVMGLLNGFLVAVLRGSSLLMTFATSKIFGGLALLINACTRRFHSQTIIQILPWQISRHSSNGIVYIGSLHYLEDI
jgi:ribose transport system permease protein